MNIPFLEIALFIQANLKGATIQSKKLRLNVNMSTVFTVNLVATYLLNFTLFQISNYVTFKNKIKISNTKIKVENGHFTKY